MVTTMTTKTKTTTTIDSAYDDDELEIIGKDTNQTKLDLYRPLPKTATEDSSVRNELERANSCEKSFNLDSCLSEGCVIVSVWRQRDAEIVVENVQVASNQIYGGVVVYYGGMDANKRNVYDF
jgi:hypothetical protein